MRVIKQEELNTILGLHDKWLIDIEGGTRAVLTDADLRGADLSFADLTSANLGGADLRGAIMTSAVMTRTESRAQSLWHKGKRERAKKRKTWIGIDMGREL